jgi:glycosyltransferase involved in cell wall biosynthesis
MTGIALMVHASAELYGSDRVLLDIACRLQQGGRYRPVVVLPEVGPLLDALRECQVEAHVAPVARISRAALSLAAPLRIPAMLAKALQALDRVIAGRDVALVHSNTLAVLGGAVWAHRRRRPHVWHVHEILTRPPVMRTALPRLAAAFSDALVCNSFSTERWLLAVAPRAHGRSVVAMNGLAMAPAADDASVAAFRAAVNAGADDIVATLIGRFNHLKGQPLLVRALARLRDTGQASKLRVVMAGDVYAGHRDFRAECASLVASLGLQARVSILPFTPDVGPIWRGSDLAVVPSTEPESFGLVAIEAMACGLPVVAAAHGGLLDIVDPDVTGVLVPPRDEVALADVLARLAGDAGMRRRMGEAGRARQEKVFTLDGQMATLLKVYDRVASR